MIRLLVAFIFTTVSLLTLESCSYAQTNCVTYKLVPRTVYKKQPLTMSRLVNETAYESQTVTTYKPVWTRETRQRTTVSYKPITKTSERVERYLVRRPVTETSYRERQIQETCYETVTEIQEQRYLVEKPVVETQYREEQVLVRKPVTTTMMQSENVTTYKPVTVTETQYVPGANVTNDLYLQAGRNRLRWLQPGYYVDPASGVARFQQRGLHWVPEQNLVVQPTVQPVLLPQQVTRTSYTPETVQVQKPVQITQYVDQWETRKVPVQVSKTAQSVHVVKTPVTVQKPVTRTRTEKVPVSEVTYREEVYERRIPVTETSYQRVENVEPYDVQVCKWVAENRVVQVPKTVTRRVNYSVDQMVPETRWIRVPVDAFGNILALPDAVVPVQSNPSDTMLSRRISNIPVRNSSVLNDVSSSTLGPTTVLGKPTIRKLSDDEYDQLQKNLKPSSVLFPESQTDSENPETGMTQINGKEKPEESESEVDASDSQIQADQIPKLLDVPVPVEPSSSDGPELDDSSDIDSRPSPVDGDNDVRLGETE